MSGEPTIVEDMEHDCELCANDGFGLISYDLAQQWSEDLKLPSTASGFCVRNAFCKGMLFPFPFREFASGKVELKNGQTFTLTTEDIVGDESRVAITYKDLPDDVKPGDTILIDDGLIGLEVKKIQKVSGTKADAEGKMPMDIVCTVMNGGMVSNKKGVNVPNVELSMPYISEKDYGDIVFAVENDYDFIAASFVRCADDVLAIRKILEEKGGEDIHIIAKIENMQGVQNIDEIIRVSDGIMVARGDMGVEIPLEDVPVIQKMIIKKVSGAGKVVITEIGRASCRERV